MTPAQSRLTPPAERLHSFQQYLAQRGAAITSTQAAALRDTAAWSRNRETARRQMRYMLGLDPMPAKTPLHAHTTGEFERELYRVEKVVFQSMPGLYVTGDLYLPKQAGPMPTVLYLCGHAPGLWGAKTHYQHHGIWLASHGYVAFLIDTIEFGEIPGIHHGLHDLGMWNWLSLGYTPAGPEVWNAIRAMDYLSARPEVDSSHIAVTGISGGGAITWYAAAVDERFRAAAPVCSTWSAGSQVAEKSVVENCDCIYFPNTFAFDLSAVGALIAPRPLKLMSAKSDEMFPPSGYNEVARELRGFYAESGVAAKFAAYDYDAHHEDIPQFRKEADEWINLWLKGGAAPFEEGDIRREEDKDLAVLTERPADAINDHIQDRFVPTAKLREWKTPAAWTQHRAAVMAELRDKTFRAMPAASVPFDTVREREMGWTNRYAEAWNVEFTTEPGVRVNGQLFLPRDVRRRDTALIYVKGSDDLVDPVDYDQILPALGQQVVLTLKPRAVDYPLSRSDLATVKRTAALLGATLESMQIYDILRAVEYLHSGEGLKPRAISIFGRRQMGAMAIYAALLEPRITRVIVDDPPASHWQDPALLNVLRFTDLPETAAMVAPREIVSLTPLPASWRYTSRIYALCSKPHAIRETHGMAEATRVP